LLAPLPAPILYVSKRLWIGACAPCRPSREGTTRRPDTFAESQQQVVHPMSFETIVIIVVIVLIVLFVLGYFGRGRMRG